ncbi:MAG: hypothetical protein WAW17_28220 [Rhodococcus sp. (in: high G+C Gram-positive bacteria)]|uniref:hypothetical protein n=1 Tax=Rhodococcus sp. TaxID=1831 RepID=UPI003BAFEC87
MTTDPTSLMEDPNLSREYKAQLVQAWAAARAEDEPLWRPFSDEYGVGAGARNPSADVRYAELLDNGHAAHEAEAAKRELGEHLRPDTLNVPDDMLDLGARGLEFFELFLSAATKLGYESLDLTDYYARFDAERGMDVNALARDIGILGRSLDIARAELDEHESSMSGVRRGWTGVAATAALDAADLGDVRAAATVGRLQVLAEVMFEVNLTLSTAVTHKAYKVASLHQSTVGGYTPAQIAVLADIYAHGRDGDNSLAKDRMEDASYWFPDLADDDFRHVNGLYKDGGAGALRWLDRDDVVRRAAAITKDWFDTNFRRVYETKQREFAVACAECAEAVHAAYDAAIAEAHAIPIPVQEQALSHPGAPETPAAPHGAPVPNVGVPGPFAGPAPSPVVDDAAVGIPGRSAQAVVSESSVPAATVPASTGGGAGGSTPISAPIGQFGAGVGTGPAMPAIQPGGLPGFGGIPGFGGVPGQPVQGGGTGAADLAGLGQDLMGGLSRLGSIIQPLVEDAVSALIGENNRDIENGPSGETGGDSPTEDADASPGGSEGGPGKDKHLAVTLDGKSWTLALDDDGRGIHLEISDELGGTSRFEVGIGPDGLPRIVTETGPEEGAEDGPTPDPGPVPPTLVSGSAGDESVAEPPGAGAPPAGEDDAAGLGVNAGGGGDGAPTAHLPQVVGVEQGPEREAAPLPAPDTFIPEPPRLPAPPSPTGFDSGAELAEAGPL